MNLLQWFGLCQHEWIEVERGETYWGTMRQGPYFIYQCKVCKKLKRVE